MKTYKIEIKKIKLREVINICTNKKNYNRFIALILNKNNKKNNINKENVLIV